ncbi:chitinase [Penicillium samsonianum]|uniref:chitinase n=1 Tax=Penicillium samsonianum TaxID=1882272 RepID=UPI002546756F|nr:chitinase [Penicillium samsonianum]KAJ6127736.1 chitinase [Penicillium samsonianum]
MAPFWSGAAVSLLVSAGIVSGPTPSRLGASPGYQGFNAVCPERCVVSGPNPSKWSDYHSMDQLASCKQSILYAFNLYDNVDDAESHHLIFACTSYGDDRTDEVKVKAASLHAAKEHPVNYEIGWRSSSLEGTESNHRSLVRQMRDYVANGHASLSKTTMLYTEFGGVIASLYISNGL